MQFSWISCSHANESQVLEEQWIEQQSALFVIETTASAAILLPTEIVLLTGQNYGYGIYLQLSYVRMTFQKKEHP